MRTAKPSQEAIERKQQAEQREQVREQLRQRLKGKKKNQLTQDDINDLVLEMAKQQGFIAQ